MRIRSTGPDGFARAAAEELAVALHDAVEQRGRATLAVSGGSTPGEALAVLADADLPWEKIHVLQVDERAVPDGHPDRNLGLLRNSLLDRVELPPANVHPMPVAGPDLEADAATYQALVQQLAGTPPVLDVVQLGLGADGHTASLVPEDPAVDIEDREVAATGTYQGHRRLTLTLPALARARRRIWLVRGSGKQATLARLLASDQRLVAARLPQADSVLVTDAPHPHLAAAPDPGRHTPQRHPSDEETPR